MVSPTAQRIMESTSLKMTFKIIQSDRSPALPRPRLTPVTEALIHNGL